MNQRLLRASLLTSLVLGLLACSGGFATREESDREVRTQRDDSRSRNTAVAIHQPSTPTRPVDVVASWEAGDTAFRQGELSEAQYQFGLVYLHEPNFRSGQVIAALNETCRLLGNDCMLVMARLDVVRIDYLDQVGPRNTWVPQQERDYQAILDCYELGLAGQLDEAYSAAHGVINAPLPVFAQYARMCAERVQQTQSMLLRAGAHAQAAAIWPTAYPPFIDAHQPFHAALTAEDWDAIVDSYPGYKIREEPIIGIVETSILSDDYRYRDEVSAAAQIINEISLWEQHNLPLYEQMRDAIATVSADPAYADALIEYEDMWERIANQQREIDTLQIARDATQGRERQTIERRIDAAQAEIRQLGRDLRRIMRTMNEIRSQNGLPPREMPQGM